MASSTIVSSFETIFSIDRLYLFRLKIKTIQVEFEKNIWRIDENVFLRINDFMWQFINIREW